MGIKFSNEKNFPKNSLLGAKPNLVRSASHNAQV